MAVVEPLVVAVVDPLAVAELDPFADVVDATEVFDTIFPADEALEALAETACWGGVTTISLGTADITEV